ncbi:MAG: Ig-like domain-containing protein [Nitrospirae bacterium]|nr:Ig-like domain-containing protein [Nitrospirota bacterium]
MKNKLLLPIFILLFCLTIILAGCGGGGTESSSDPGGVNTAIPSVVKLLPVQFIAQTNSFITLKARVLDGNGNAVPNYPVSFTNMSLTGTLSAVTANTNNAGNAEVRIFSSTPGFATIIAQVTAGSGIVRDRKTIYFSTNDILATAMSMDVNSVPGNSTYNEISDFTLFENATDDTVEVLATIFDAGGVPVGGGVGVSWDSEFKRTILNPTGEANFLREEIVTNVFGQAKAVIQILPASIRNTETHLNVFAFSSNGSANMVTLFLQPVVVSAAASSLTADPLTVAPGGSSALTAVVKLTTGAVAPDGTIVNFTTTCGTVTPFGQTTDGVATGTFKAPVTEGTCTVTATVQGVAIGSVDINVARALAVFPATASISGGTGGSAVFTITGGTPPYNITSTNTAIVPNGPVAASGGTFTATVPALTPAGTVTVQVRDSAGTTVTVTITITP